MTEQLPDPNPSDWPSLDSSHLRIINEDNVLYRLYSSGGTHPVRWHEFRHWGPSAARFDHHPLGPPTMHPNHGAWYAALETRGDDPTGLYTAIAERFQDARTIPIADSSISVAACTTGHPVNLLDLESRWLTQSAGNGAIESGPRFRSRQWARAIRATYPEVHGLIWRSSVFRPGQAVVLWDLPRDSLAPTPRLNRTIDQLAPLLIPAAKRLGYRVSWHR